MTAIVPTDILFKLSAPNANSGNSQAGYPGTSWGGYLSTSLLNLAFPLDNLFTDITGAEFAGNQVDYACIFIQNNTATTHTMMNTVAWLPSSQFTGTGSSIQLGADPTGITAINSGPAQASIITSSTIAPAGVNTWVNPTNTVPTAPSYTNGLQLGNISPTQCVAIWLKRTANSTTTPSLTSLQIQVVFNSAN